MKQNRSAFMKPNGFYHRVGVEEIEAFLCLRASFCQNLARFCVDQKGVHVAVAFD